MHECLGETASESSTSELHNITQRANALNDELQRHRKRLAALANTVFGSMPETIKDGGEAKELSNGRLDSLRKSVNACERSAGGIDEQITKLESL